MFIMYKWPDSAKLAFGSIRLDMFSVQLQCVSVPLSAKEQLVFKMYFKLARPAQKWFGSTRLGMIYARTLSSRYCSIYTMQQLYIASELYSCHVHREIMFG